MSKTKHTPGEWEAKNIAGAGWQVHNEDDNIIASMGWYQFPSEKMNPEISGQNAKLIAAAPKLLKALRGLCEEIENQGIYFEKVGMARESIKQATS